MKFVALTTAALFAASTAFAGSYNTNLEPTTPVEPPVAVDPTPETPAPGSLGGSGAWLVPAVAIVLIGLAVSQSQSDDDE